MRRKKKIGYYRQSPEIVVGSIGDVKNLEQYFEKLNKRIPEIKVRVTRGREFTGNLDKITSSEGAAEVLRKYFVKSKIETQEFGACLYTNHQNAPVGIYMHSAGGITATIMDPRLIISTALKLAATGMIIAHNHPSGNLKPSVADEQITRKIKEGASLFDITLFDHIILTKEGFFSFADNGTI